MTSPVEGHTVFVPYPKESGNETTTTSSGTSIDAAKAEANLAAAEKDAATGRDDNDATVEADETTSAESAGNDDEADYLPLGTRLYLIVFSLLMAVFCVALDNTVRLHATRGPRLLLTLLRSSPSRSRVSRTSSTTSTTWAGTARRIS